MGVLIGRDVAVLVDVDFVIAGEIGFSTVPPGVHNSVSAAGFKTSVAWV
jgi:hypothetical protein